MPSEKKRYRFTYRGKRYAIYACTDREAGKLIAEKKHELEEDAYLRSTGMTLRRWAPECIAAYKQRQNETTKKQFTYIVDHAILPELGDLRLIDITPIDCQKVMAQTAGMSTSWINAVYQAMRFLFSKAVLNGFIKKDPTEGLERPRGTKNKRRALTPDERQRILEVAPTNQSFWVYLLMMLCGCRPGEAAECKRSDVSEVLDRSGAVRHLLHIRGTKTANADRMVPLPPMLWDLINDLPMDAYLSTTRQGTKHGQNWRRHFNLLSRKAGLGDDLVPYCLRHEFGTECARRGLDVRVTMKLMGHSSIRITADIYTNLQQVDILEATSALEEGTERAPAWAPKSVNG